MRVVITGANRGIGLEFCRQFKNRGEDVIAVCRSSSDELDALGVEVFDGIDLRNSESVSRFRSLNDGQKIDVLINNAGILCRESLDEMNFEQMLDQFEVNTLGPLRLTHALLDCLGTGTKVVMITSRMGSIADNTSGSRYGYRMSKAALNIAGVSLAHDLRPRGISVALLHPGYVRTRMTAHHGYIDPEESVTGLMMRIDQLNLENTGTFWHGQGEVLPW